jgi:SAM-dependent methyltransferase
MAERDETRAWMLAQVRDEAARPRPSVLAAIAAVAPAAGWRVLDAGCGPGPHLGLLLDAVAPGGSVVGLDLEADRLEVAAAHWAKEVAAGRLRLERGDLMRLPFPGAAFDLAWSSLALHHVADPGQAVRELARVVAPGGLVVILDGDDGASFPGLPWPPALEARLRAAVFRGAAEDYGGQLDYAYVPYLGRDLPRLCREAGLADIQLRIVADVDRAPLGDARAAEIGDWVRDWLDGRVRDYLAPTDRAAVLALFDPARPGYLPRDPDFFLSRSWFLVTGRRPN